jgi:hypothetical protein
VRYEAVNAMLLNEFLKEHRKVEQLESKAQDQERNAQKQEAMIAKQQKQIEALTAGLQKVSEQVEMSRPVRLTISKAAGPARAQQSAHPSLRQHMLAVPGLTLIAIRKAIITFY